MEKNKGKLYLVATPIGNLGDMTLRAINVLKEVDIIAAEDTRHTLGLLNHLNISKPLISYYKEVEKNKSEQLIEKLLEGKNIAVVSDAGTPCISDPGEEIVIKALNYEIEVIPVPGACAFINALIISGLSTKEFTFCGFLSTNKKEKVEKLSSLKYYTHTLIFYEAPHKLINTLEIMNEVFGNRKICLVRELTKIHEERIDGTLTNVIEKMRSKDIKGEFVIVVQGSTESIQEVNTKSLNEMSLEEHYKHYQEMGLEKKEIIKRIAKDRKVTKNEIYQHFINE